MYFSRCCTDPNWTFVKKLDTETVVYEGDGMTLECEVSDREAEVFWSRMGKV